jgi:hypothetical protein
MAEGDYRPVPVEAAKHVAQVYEKDQVVILAWDRAHETLHTTTYGKTAEDKVSAGGLAVLCNQAAGLDGEPRTTFEHYKENFDPALLKECLEVLEVISRRQGTTGPQLQQIERILKSRGQALRQG